MNLKRMSLQEATRIRALQLQGKPVLALSLKEALEVIEESAPRPQGGRKYKWRLPHLTVPERQMMNAVLLLNIGRAMGRIEERRAA